MEGKGKPEQMRSVVINDMQDYVKKHGRLIAVSIAAAILCFGFLAFSSNIRIDTEELINHPGTTVGWLTIGRYGLAFLKRVLGLGVHSALWSGLLFLVFFVVGANLLTFLLYHFSEKQESYPYWVFLLLYITSNIWSYQVYFSLQQAEIACAMLLVVLAAGMSMRACFVERGRKNVLRFLVSALFLVIGLGAYQALAAYYITICLVLFLVLLDGKNCLEAGKVSPGKKEPGKANACRKEPGEAKACREEPGEAEACREEPGKNGRSRSGQQDRELLWGIGKLLLLFGISYLLYHVIANTWFMAASDYMEGQMGWGRLTAVECVKNVLRTARNLLMGNGPRNFSFYTVGALLTVVLVAAAWRKKGLEPGAGMGMRFGLFLLALAGILISPFLMTIYMGEMLVTRSQFALPVAAAFLGMYGIRGLKGLSVENERTKNRILKICGILVCLTIAVQAGYHLRLAYTDAVRYRQDTEKTEELLAALKDVNGGRLPEQPIIFVGYQEAELGTFCRRTEMYGWSFYEWDYSVDNPTGATHRIAGFVQASTGNVLNESSTDADKAAAVELAETMPDFPEKGSVRATGEFVVVKLSEVRERTDVDWW